ncbi:SGNH/GDSL hydrolase family protein [Nocardioides sp. P5_C9_2]
MSSRSPRLLAGLAALVLAATACSGADGSAGPADFVAPTFGDLPSEIDYVALGDSYSAGPLVTTVRSDPSGCVRSTDNYPAFLAGWLSVESYRDVTCSGAETADLTGNQQVIGGANVAPQLDALSEDTDLVTLGIGGNDFGIFSSLVGCAPGGAQACPPGLQQRLLRDAGRVRARVAGVVRQVSERAPEAEVYVVGYPQVLPTEDGCPAVSLPPAQLETAATVAQQLNDSLRRGAESAGATYVDLDEASEGHDVCAGPEAWINGPQALPGVAAPFHPLLAGMRGVAEEVFSTVTGDEAPDTETASPPRDAVVRNEVPAG